MKNTMVQKLLASSKSRMSSQAGFTLVELMVVVAIIGVLATLAVPQYQRFTAKSRQSEVKIALGAARSALESFRPENGLTGCLDQAGYQSSQGRRYYAVGFGATQVGVDFCGPQGVQDCAGFSGWGDGAAATAPTGVCDVDNMQFPATIGAEGVALAPVTEIPAGAVIGAANEYIIGAGGNIRALATQVSDQWTINQTGELSNTRSGI
jgi:type IV pilus assembly protein PilA